MKTMCMWVIVLATTCFLPRTAAAVVTVYFNPDQIATPVASGQTWDTIECEGYRFTYTRDKLFTGGGTDTIGRPVRIPWPDGIEAQYVTAGPTPGKAKITVQRVDGAIFDLTSFTAHLLANAGAGRAIEIVPMLNGEEPLNDPLYFDVSGYYGQEFSYDTSPNPWGSTAPLVDYDTYVIGLTLDYALTALTLADASQPSAAPVGPVSAGPLTVWPNPAAGPVRITLGGPSVEGREALSVFDVRGRLVRSLVAAAGNSTWDLRDDGGGRVAPGIYFLGRTASPGGGTQRIVILR